MDPIDHLPRITAFCVCRAFDRAICGSIFRRDLSAPEYRERHKKMIADAVLDYLKA
ncbi:hypothetical protein ACQQ2Q_20780 [Agrobacterium sp. ES01]|uniref:hypothetical protein n=1 Tax=Agrobacterium sp. ES01 TaxID=3420714 RepID=UPI003D108F46